MMPGIFAGAMGGGGGGGGGNVDDFSTNTLSLYTPYGSVGTPSIAGGQLLFGSGGVSQGALARTGEVVTDGEVGVVISQAFDAGFVFRLQDVNNYYLAAIYDQSSSSGASDRVYLYRRQLGSFYALQNVAVSFPRGTPRKFHALLAGTSIKLFFNDTEIISVIDANFASGLAGPRSNGTPGVFESYFWP